MIGIVFSEFYIEVVNGFFCEFAGFLIVSYMVERMDCSVEAAILAFAQARPPGIYKDDYIKELFRRYDDIEDALPAPEKPTWCGKGIDNVFRIFFCRLLTKNFSCSPMYRQQL